MTRAHKLALTLANILLLSSSLTQAQSSWGSGWTPSQDSMLSRRSAESPASDSQTTTAQPDIQGRNYAVNEREPIYSNDTEIASIIDQVLNSRREGRNLGQYDQIYADGNIDQALQQGNDMMARNLIREKLCGLGLMSCEVEEKRPFYSTIYAQGPPQPHFGGGPYGPAKPMPPPPNRFNSRPPPPPSSPNSFGPPRKVGYEAPFKPNYRPEPSYNGPYLEHPPSTVMENNGGITFNRPPPGAVIYGSKPPGPVFNGNSGGPPPPPPPYAFENPGVEKLQTAGSQQNSFYSQHAASSAASASTSKFVVGSIAPAPPADVGLQQHVHHHYHHVEGTDAAKAPTVPIPISNSQSINTDFSSLAQSSTAFTPQINSAGYSQSPAYTAGFNGASQGSLLSQSYKPNVEHYKPDAGLSSFGGSAGGFAQETGDFGSNGFGGVGSSFHSQNPDYFKKELQHFGNVPSPSNSIDAGFGGGSQYPGGFETSRQQFVDCQCVPFNQCPAADRIGRKEDLILPIDPRNIGKDIEALSDDIAANSTTTTAPATAVKSETKTDDDKKENEEDSKRSKRQAAGEEKQDEAPLPLDAEGFRQGFAALQAIALVKRKILPTYGVSFGLPNPSAGSYPTNPHADQYPAQNPYFGSIGPNGLNLGLINVNPLVSVQVSKTEYGNNVVKPYVNLHVTPNANLLQSVANIFKKKPEYIHNTHYHHHDHYKHYSDVDHVPYEHEHFEPPVHTTFIDMVPSNPIFEYHSSSGGPPLIDLQQYQTANQHYDDSSLSSFTETTSNFNHGDVHTTAFNSYPTATDVNFNQFSHEGGLYDINYNNEYAGGSNNIYDRSSNISGFDTPSFASRYKEFPIESTRTGKQLSFSGIKLIPTQAPGNAKGSDYITFPKDRRRRQIEEHEQTAELNESVLSRSIRTEQRAYYGNRPVNKVCRVNEVCCRRPLRPPQQQQLGRCGTRNAAGITGRVTNPVYVDGDSEFGEYPWHVAILKKDPKESIYACGGTLIDAQHVLTAAHCIKSQNGFDLRARLGEWDVNHDVEFFPYIERDIVSVHIHPEYYAGTLDNDLAVLKLDFPVDFTKNPHISPACLPDKFSDYTGARCWTTGWGKDAFGQQGKYQNILKEVDVPILSHQQCESQLRQTRLGYSYKLNPGFVCAGGEEGKDACKGDGGGPLVCERNGIWNVVGVVSWGIGCGQPNVPGVYVKVSNYLEWISQITQYYK